MTRLQTQQVRCVDGHLQLEFRPDPAYEKVFRGVVCKIVQISPRSTIDNAHEQLNR